MSDTSLHWDGLFLSCSPDSQDAWYAQVSGNSRDLRVPLESLPMLFTEVREYDALSPGTVVRLCHSDNERFTLSESVRTKNVEKYDIRSQDGSHIHLVCADSLEPGLFMQCTFAAVNDSEGVHDGMHAIVLCGSRYVISIKRHKTRITAKPMRDTRQTLLPIGLKTIMIVDVFVPSTVHGGFNQIARVVSNTFDVVCKLNF